VPYKNESDGMPGARAAVKLGGGDATTFVAMWCGTTRTARFLGAHDLSLVAHSARANSVADSMFPLFNARRSRSARMRLGSPRFVASDAP